MDVIGVNNQFAVRAGVVSVAPALCQLRGAVLEPLTQTSTDGFAFFNDIHRNLSFHKIKTIVTEATTVCWIHKLLQKIDRPPILAACQPIVACHYEITIFGKHCGSIISIGELFQECK
jgi:hypothetical protein